MATQTCFLLPTTVTAVQLYTRGNLNQLTTSCGHWNFDLVHFGDLVTGVAVTAKTLINAAAAALLMCEWNTTAYKSRRLDSSSYITVLFITFFCDRFCHYQDVCIYAAVSLPSRQLNTLWIFPLEYMPQKKPVFTTTTVVCRKRCNQMLCVTVNKQSPSVMNDLLNVLCLLPSLYLTSPPSISNNGTINRYYIIKPPQPPQFL